MKPKTLNPCLDPDARDKALWMQLVRTILGCCSHIITVLKGWWDLVGKVVTLIGV